IDTLDAPRLLTWAVRVPDLDAALAAARDAGHDPGPGRAMSRRRPDGELLAWTLAFPPDDLGGVVPFVIDWGSTPHPTASLDDGARLAGLRIGHPDPDRVRSILRALGADTADVAVGESAEPGLTARIVLADGTERTLA
ncbi:MAG: VOC family protein, partial [Pseudonocardia sediminis]